MYAGSKERICVEFFQKQIFSFSTSLLINVVSK